MTPQQIFDKLVEARRGDMSAEHFLQPDYVRDLHDPWLLPDMESAVCRLIEAKEKDQIVVIYGDYDIDGLTATTLMLEACEAWGIRAESYIPSRFTEGYGLNTGAVESIAKKGAELIITVDCGSLSVQEVITAKQLGVDVIITDHHTIGDVLPNAVAVVNPKRKDHTYPNRELAGVGVAFKFVCAAQQRIEGLTKGAEKWLLDLVALGTVCDLVPLTGENRVLVHWGLVVARHNRRLGLSRLYEISGCSPQDLRAEDFGFRVGPRLNAAGRMESALASLELLRTKDSVQAQQIAEQLEQFNTARKNEQEEITKSVLEQAAHDESNILVLADAEWSHGIVGIVAAKVMRQVKKPTLIMQIIGDRAKGSARGFGSFDWSKALQHCGRFLESGGGHQYAAGCSLLTADLPSFRKELNSYYGSLQIGDQSDALTPSVDIDIESPEILDLEMATLLDALEPYGQSNPSPLFRISAQEVTVVRFMGAGEKHCRVLLKSANGSLIESVHFGRARELKDFIENSPRVDCFVSLEKNHFRGDTTAQLQLVHWESAS